MKRDRYYVDELLGYSEVPQLASQGRIYDLDPVPCRIMRIIDSFYKIPVHVVNLTEKCIPAMHVYDECLRLNEEFEAYQKTLLEYVNS